MRRCHLRCVNDVSPTRSQSNHCVSPSCVQTLHTSLAPGVQPVTPNPCQVGILLCFAEKEVEPFHVTTGSSDGGARTSSRHHVRTPESPAVSNEQDTVTADQLCEHHSGRVPSYKSCHIIKRATVASRRLCVACRLQLS